VSHGATIAQERDERLIAAALRVYRRYQLEIVEGLHLCPWAARARLDGQVREQVLLIRHPDVDATVDAVTTIADDAQFEIGLLIFPRLQLSRADFERFVARVREEDTRRTGDARGGVRMAMAAFHPDASADLANAERLVPFLRRSPDATIQLVRRTALDRVRAGDDAHGTGMVDLTTIDLAAFLAAPPQPPIHERIAAHNLATVKERGSAAVEALLADILRDRDESYAALGD